MNPATAFARVLVDELLRGGVTDAVLAPGSRSAPVALALAAAERAGRLRLHVRIDERTAAFLALGLAKASGRAVPVLTTSGTAAAHLHAAVLEADASGVPLLALTADRPPELRATGANQTIEQPGLYGGAVRWAADVGVPEAGREAAQNRYWRSAGRQGAAHRDRRARPRPGPGAPEPRAARAADARRRGARGAVGPLGRPRGRRTVDRCSRRRRTRSSRTTVWRQRTLVVAGDGSPFWGRIAGENAGWHGWPVIAEPSSGAWTSRVASAAGRCCSAAPAGWPGTGPTASSSSAGRRSPGRSPRCSPTRSRGRDRRRRTAVARRRPVERPGRASASRTGREGSTIEPAWAAEWRAAALAVGTAVDAVLDAAPGLDRRPAGPRRRRRAAVRVAAGAGVVDAGARRRPAGRSARRPHRAGQSRRRRHRRDGLDGGGGSAGARADRAWDRRSR